MKRPCGWIAAFGVFVAALLVGGCSAITELDGGQGQAAVPLSIHSGQVVTGGRSPVGSNVNPQTLIATGGTPGVNQYTWSLPSGSPRFPAGCTVDQTGVFRGQGGQLVASGTYPFVMQVSDGTRTATGTITLQVADYAILPAAIFQQIVGMGTWQLPDAQANKVYGHSLYAMGGTPPYNWFEDTSYAGRAEFDASGLSINRARGTVWGTVMNSAAGKTLRFRVVVRDSTGATAESGDLTYEIVVR